MISYLQLKQTLAISPLRIPLNAPDELKRKVQRLKDCGLVWEHRPFPRDDHDYTTFHLSDRTPKPASDVIERVQVSFWQTGARAGLFSQQAYRVLPSDNPRKGYVTIELMTGKPYTVAVERTKAVA